MAAHNFAVSLTNSGSQVSIPSQFRAELTINTAPTNSYWAESMELASNLLTSGSGYSHVLWLNDDVELFPDSVSKLISVMSSKEADIVVGQTTTKSGMTSYGGFVRKSMFKPLHFNRVFAGDHPIRAETFNGNIVLLGPKALRTIGPFLSGYKHYLADIAYGLEANGLALSIFVAPGSSGVCESNLKPNPALDRTIPRRTRLRVLDTAPGLPIRQQWRFSTRYGGLLGLVYFCSTYARFIWNLAFYKKPNS